MDADARFRKAAVGVTAKGNSISRELPAMMYGYGDSREPRQDSVDLVHKLVIEYITGVTMMALDKAAEVGEEPSLPMFTYVLHGDKRKLSRVNQLLVLQEEIRRERQLARANRNASKRRSRKK